MVEVDATCSYLGHYSPPTSRQHLHKVYAIYMQICAQPVSSQSRTYLRRRSPKICVDPPTHSPPVTGAGPRIRTRYPGPKINPDMCRADYLSCRSCWTCNG